MAGKNYSQNDTRLAAYVSFLEIYRLLKAHNLLERDVKPVQECKRFAYDKVNILWQGDMSVGYYLVIGGKKYRT